MKSFLCFLLLFNEMKRVQDERKENIQNNGRKKKKEENIKRQEMRRK